MKKQETKRKKWSIAIVVMLCMAFFSQLILKFDIKLVWIITSIFLALFIPLGEKIYKQEEGKEVSGRCYLVWGISMISIGVAIGYVIESGNMIVEEGYFKWLKEMTKERTRCLEYEIGTLIIGQYVCFLLVYGYSAWKAAKHKMNDWIPRFWGLISGIGIVFYIKEGFNVQSRLNIIIATGCLLVAYQVIRYLDNREKKIIMEGYS